MAWTETNIGSGGWSGTDITDSRQEVFDSDIFDNEVFQCATHDWDDEVIGDTIWV